MPRALLMALLAVIMRVAPASQNDEAALPIGAAPSADEATAAEVCLTGGCRYSGCRGPASCPGGACTFNDCAEPSCAGGAVRSGERRAARTGAAPQNGLPHSPGARTAPRCRPRWRGRRSHCALCRGATARSSAPPFLLERADQPAPVFNRLHYSINRLHSAPLRALPTPSFRPQCTFSSCRAPTCSGGACSFDNCSELALGGDGYCTGGGCTTSGDAVCECACWLDLGLQCTPCVQRHSNAAAAVLPFVLCRT